MNSIDLKRHSEIADYAMYKRASVREAVGPWLGWRPQMITSELLPPPKCFRQRSRDWTLYSNSARKWQRGRDVICWWELRRAT